MKAIKLIGGNTIHTPNTYSTVDRATYVRIVSYSSGGTNFGVFTESGGSYTRVARYAMSARSSMVIKKEPDQYIGEGSALSRCSAVATEG
tara:strand:- start:18 stop:287 length:270 start_codon:yes stop_codon:yes gene_type:complete